MSKVEIVAVGTELLLGQLVDTNTAHIAQALAANGIDVYATHAVGDNRERIAATLVAALQRADGVITSGGLGPTIDDLTKEATCDALGVDAVMNEEALRDMHERFSVVVGREMPANNRKQALLPRGALMLKNPHGSAPGYIAFSKDGKFIASMPGVPSEMKPMLAERLLPWLGEKFGSHSFITTRTLHTMGIAESELDERIGDLFATQENPKIAVLAHGGRCDVKLMAKTGSSHEAQALIEPLEQTIRERLSGVIFGDDDDTLESVVLRGLCERGQTLAVAESCTGGRVAAALTRVAGASKSFVGGIVAYDNSVKIQHLGVQTEDLNAYGAVSSEVAAEMATGARERFGASIALSVTGVAGPQGGTSEKPVGLVWFGLADPSGVKTRKMQFRGDREIVQQRATAYALGLLWKRVRQAEPNVAPTT
ncbi:MAG: competence/damage-inducible protein A [Candidatus Eremiobacteraeota bacterium]|nr:competence/damage-inducible protein A [Candidatus Eremiobacteraeota bacterium]